MQWRGRRQSGNIEDRRGRGGGGGLGGLGRMGGGARNPIGLPGGGGSRGGGIGIGTIVIILIVGWFLGINPLALIGGLGGGDSGMQIGPQGGATTGQQGTPADERGQFVSTVLADTEDTWNQIFSAAGQRYQEPTLVLFTNSTSSACGFASAATGPFYCPADQKLYIDLGFYDELANRFNAPGDFAEAYVIAHEVGHHVQNLVGTLPKVNQERQRVGQSESNELSIRTELQADCYAGIWAKHSQQVGAVEDGDIEEALTAAAAVGDDAIQKRTQGYVVPESFNHGTSAQRAKWFKQGLQSGTVDSCDTFSVAQP
jgi:predicted metalloprotease